MRMMPICSRRLKAASCTMLEIKNTAANACAAATAKATLRNVFSVPAAERTVSAWSEMTSTCSMSRILSSGEVSVGSARRTCSAAGRASGAVSRTSSGSDSWNSSLKRS